MSAELGFFEAIILGVTEGLTEFIPVSSTGHLILVSNLLGLHGEKIKVFEICIQFGSILAIAVLYLKKLLSLLNPALKGGFQGLRGMSCLIAGCLPAVVLGALFSSQIKELLFYPIPVGFALIAGSVLIILTEKYRKSRTVLSLDQLTPALCLAIGMVQALSLWPGMSRAATSMLGGLAFGLERKVAAEFSFLMAVPLIAAATAHDLYQNWSILSAGDIPVFLCGSLVAFLSALLAVRAFISLISKVSLLPFAYYRLAVGVGVIWYFG